MANQSIKTAMDAALRALEEPEDLLGWHESGWKVC